MILGVEKAILGILYPGVYPGDIDKAAILARMANATNTPQKSRASSPNRCERAASGRRARNRRGRYALAHPHADGVFVSSYDTAYLGDPAFVAFFRFDAMHPPARDSLRATSPCSSSHKDPGCVLSPLTDRFQSAASGALDQQCGASRPSPVFERVYFDLAGAIVDPKNLFYGSDYPFTPAAVASQFAEALEGPDAVKEQGKKGALEGAAWDVSWMSKEPPFQYRHILSMHCETAKIKAIWCPMYMEVGRANIRVALRLSLWTDL
ncbi:hypothetical protein FIBSPDRAFT_888150 [Athelia psychrophila]|uniref:Amidohydrolase-related domain-containing protein n=1 Tax=Athelia psychrophila TaxID=1759441 RepID=A0A166NSS3_9AGAM|nr:hypothetical protein FIBSPDRAFT_888150 [Fibularhizoctonia sp. CBS 109695]